MKDAEKPFFPVIAAGLFTTLLTLTGLHYLNLYTDWNPMGLYAAGIFPVGAIGIGLLAASGYGIAIKTMGIRVNYTLMGTILALQLLAYFAAQYIEYLDVVRQLKATVGEKGAGLVDRHFTFFHYWDMAARNMAWKGKYGQADEPLGVLGYGIRALEIIGFAGGGLIAPASLRKTPYCERCQRYRKTKSLTLLAAALPAKLFQKTEKEARERAFAEGVAEVDRLRKLAAEGDIKNFRAGLDAANGKRKEANAVPLRFELEIVSCPTCGDGYLQVARIEQQGNNLTRTVLPDKIPVSIDFVRAFA